MTDARRPVARLAIGGALTAWVLCVFASGATVGWYDAPELAAAGQQLGVAHAPGEPAYLLLVRMAQLVPLGDLAARAVWLSSAFVAALVALVVWLTAELIPRATTLALGFVACACALCSPLWTQGVIVELYGLQALLSLGALAAVCAARGEARGWILAGALVGFGGAVNPLLTVLALPGAVVVVVARHGRPAWISLALGTVAAVAFGASCYLYLPLRSAAEPGVCFAILDSPATVTNFVTGKPYARSFGPLTSVELVDNLVTHLRLLIAWCGFPALVLAALGAVIRARTGSAVVAGWILLGLGSWLTTVPRPGLETFTPDVAGYLLISVLAVIALAAAGVSWIQRRSAIAAAAVTVLAVGWAGASGVGAIRVHRETPAQHAALALLEATPIGGILLTGSDSTALPVLYATTTGRRRPDLFAAPLYLLEPRLLRRQAVRHPRLALGDWTGSAEWLARPLIAANAHLGVVGTPLLWPPELVDRRVPMGIGVALDRPGETPLDLGRRGAALSAALVEPLWSPTSLLRDRQLRRLLSSTAATHAEIALKGGHTQVALGILSRASSLHPDPWAMVHLQRASVESGQLAPPAHHGLASSEILDDADVLEARALEQFWARDFAAASATWDAALALRPGSPQSLAGKERLYAMGVP